MSQEPVNFQDITIYLVPPGEMATSVGTLEQDAFAYIGDWHLRMKKEGYGLAYRFGMVHNFMYDGQFVNLTLCFGTLIAHSGISMTPEMHDEANKTFVKMVMIYRGFVNQKYGNAVAELNTNPPDWVLSDLEEVLKQG